ncbi:peptidyl-prolyl cis-trans isomerase [Rhizobium laguerreae]|uniref:peptidylprolyl isomerase n=1 Tax=Rhizobium laguerreae TaxID=1076926 RepID=UPI001C919A00|nr:peptidylprolyl isomerase [Rhizobium laguerreae]MBY3088409.1 peptidyl-prolyl cis-trans isomerase [Rhizobium laguerreae]MBY3149389.1 peptidyl-prolyl cis-trans isomerase [Rhizobium laguerreae]
MKLLREPLLHFLVIGAVLFAVYQWATGDKAAPDEIVVRAGQIASLQAIFSQTWQRPPTGKETQALVDGYIRDEVVYREGVAMGLDRDDAVIRRRIRQKMEFVADLTADVQPTEAELKAFVADHPDRFRAEPRVSFTQVYFPAGAQAANEAEVERLRLALNAGSVDPSAAGSPLLSGSDFRDLARSEVAQAFGVEFAAWIEKAKPGTWQGPVTSGYGTHLVRVSERTDARELPFEQVRDAASREWIHARKVEANDAFYEKLRSRYIIEVENMPGASTETIVGAAQ